MGGYRRRLKDQRILVILHTESKPSFSIRVAVWSKFSCGLQSKVGRGDSNFRDEQYFVYAIKRFIIL